MSIVRSGGAAVFTAGAGSVGGAAAAHAKVGRSDSSAAKRRALISNSALRSPLDRRVNENGQTQKPRYLGSGEVPWRLIDRVRDGSMPGQAIHPRIEDRAARVHALTEAPAYKITKIVANAVADQST